MRELPATLRTAVALAGVAAVGTLLLAIAHLGVEVPLLSAFGPRGGAVPAAVVGFAVATLLFTTVAVGLARRNRLAWLGGLAVGVLAVIGGAGQFRGVVSAVGIGVAVVLVGLLLAPSSRAAVGR